MATILDSRVLEENIPFSCLLERLKIIFALLFGSRTSNIFSEGLCLFIFSRWKAFRETGDVGSVNKGRTDTEQERECQHFHCSSDTTGPWVRGHNSTYPCWTSFWQQQMLQFRDNHSIEEAATLYPKQLNAVFEDNLGTLLKPRAKWFDRA